VFIIYRHCKSLSAKLGNTIEEKKTKRTLILSIEEFFTTTIRALSDKEFLLEKWFLKCKTLEFKSIFPSLKNKIRKI
jgi:hypothetical protein